MRRHRPPWWPENEPWPPEGPEAWRRLRSRFMRRALVLVAMVFAAFAAVLAGLVWLLGALGVHVQSIIAGIVAVLVLALALRWIVRGFRYAAGPVGELIEASGRMEAGQLGIQVPERGPREVRQLTRSFNAMSEGRAPWSGVN